MLSMFAAVTLTIIVGISNLDPYPNPGYTHRGILPPLEPPLHFPASRDHVTFHGSECCGSIIPISLMMSSEAAEIASIACEPCRHKKCKCDRRLPICTQCKSTPAKCHYPEKNRRGIPAGYVNALEKRLAETERALFFALAEIHAGTVARHNYESPMLRQAMEVSVLSGPIPTTQQDKAQLMATWAKSPLADREQAYAWFEANQGEANLPTLYEESAASIKRGVDTVTPSTSPTVIPKTSRRPVGHPLRNSQAGASASNETSVTEDSQQNSHRGSTRRGMFTGWEESHPEETFSDASNEGNSHLANMSQASKASDIARANKSLYF